MSELTKRVLFAIPAAALAIWVTWTGGIYFYIALILLVMFVQFEIQRIADKAGFKPARFFPYVISLWIVLTPVLPFPFEIGIGLFLFFAAVQVINTKKKHMQEFIATIFCAGYSSFGLFFLLLIRMTGSDSDGFIFTILLFLMIWGNDVFAYFGGRLFGKHLLAPTISPNKTWEGFFSGFVGSIIGLSLMYLFVPDDFNLGWLMMIPGALAVSIFAPLGDLAESKLKRAADVKDASNLLPGHGGFFDRFDGVILAAPAFYLYLHVLQIIGYVSF